MFMMLLDGIALLILLGLGYLALMFAGAALGALIGTVMVAVRSLFAKSVPPK